jgi:hypothetical protein
MAKLVVSTYVGSGSLWMYLDDKLILQNSENLGVEINNREHFVIHWFVMGDPGSSYSITISTPNEAQLQLTRSIGETRKDHGGILFKS